MADNLWLLREQKKISVATLANRTGLPIGLIMEYESGQRSIDPRHLSRLARALYVEEAQIKLQSDPRPGAAPLERQTTPREQQMPQRPAPAGRAPIAAPRPRERSPRPKAEPRPPAPPRPSQLSHLDNLLRRLNQTREDLTKEIGKTVDDLDRSSLSELLKTLQSKVAESATAERHRAYLPEAVDEFESKYLTAAQAHEDQLHFVMFDGKTLDAQVIGFGPYSITVRLVDGSEMTLNKLALVSYRKAGHGEKEMAA